ncbi:MAG: hypothetical protein HW389_769 [Bacteroidetes bacterium]|nr:hypothetical protein [Bacteroidota bacterium]
MRLKEAKRVNLGNEPVMWMLVDFDYEPRCRVFWADGYVGPLRDLQKVADRMLESPSLRSIVDREHFLQHDYRNPHTLFHALLWELSPKLHFGWSVLDLYTINLSGSRASRRLSLYPILGEEAANRPSNNAYYAAIGVMEGRSRGHGYNEEKAKQILSEAGLRIKENYRDKDGFKGDLERLLGWDSDFMEPFLAPCLIGERKLRQVGLKAKLLF